jgi:predicted oxidoreductase (fatty acid repression mutant protein)
MYTIKFTYEIEQQNVLCFLDAEIRRSDTNLDFNVYRKPTATERYITIDLHHCVQHKSATFNSMVNRLFTIPMSAENQLKDLKKIKLAKTNGYSEELATEFTKNI